jgi:hypothetical protein
MGMIYKRGEIFLDQILFLGETDPGEYRNDETESSGTVSEAPRRTQRGRLSTTATRGPHHLSRTDARSAPAL